MNNNPWSQIPNNNITVNAVPGGVPVGISPASSKTKRIGSIVGGAVLVILAAFGLIKAVPGLSSGLAAAVSSFSGVFVPRDEISLSLPSTVTSGTPFAIGWDKKGESDGLYTLSYDCRDGAYLKAKDQTGVERVVFCNTPFSFAHEGNSVTVTALSETTVNDVGINIAFTPNGETTSQADASQSITIAGVPGSTGENQTSATTATSTGSTGNSGTAHTSTSGTYYGPRPTSAPSENTYLFSSSSSSVSGWYIDPNGLPDLTTKITAIGVLNKRTGEFTATSTFSADDRVAIRFEIENRGTNVSGMFNMQVIMPTAPTYVYDPGLQPSLRPGEKIKYTVGFDKIQYGKNDIVVKADPGNLIFEPNNDNNNDSVRVNINLPIY